MNSIEEKCNGGEWAIPPRLERRGLLAVMVMKLPSKEWLIAQVKKKFHIRVSILSLFLAVWLIVDELVKEGYYFNPADIANPFSHEFLVTVLLLLAAINYVIYRLRL